MPPARKPPETFWKKSAYVVAADINATAIFRLTSTVLGAVVLGLLGYFGNRIVTSEDQMVRQLAAMSQDAVAIHQDIGEIKGTITMMNDRATRIITRINTDENRLTALETKLDLLMERKR